jgi:hypothetical protein
MGMIMSIAGIGLQLAAMQKQEEAAKLQAQTQVESAAYQGQIAVNNAAMAQQNQAWTLAEGDVAASEASMKGAAEIATMKAAAGGRGFNVNVGSFPTARTAADWMNNANIRIMTSDTARKAYAYDVARESWQREAAQKALEGGYAVIAGQEGVQMAEISGLAGVASSLGSMFSTFGGGGGGGAGGLGGGMFGGSPNMGTEGTSSFPAAAGAPTTTGGDTTGSLGDVATIPQVGGFPG